MTRSNNDNRLVSAREAARMLGLSSRRVRSFIREGRLPAALVGNSWVIKVSDVKAFAAIERLPGRPKE